MDRRARAEDLEEVINKFTSWRSNRKGRSAIPGTLWDMAVILCAQYPISKISTTLRLDYTKLRRYSKIVKEQPEKWLPWNYKSALTEQVS